MALSAPDSKHHRQPVCRCQAVTVQNVGFRSVAIRQTQHEKQAHTCEYAVMYMPAAWGAGLSSAYMQWLTSEHARGLLNWQQTQQPAWLLCLVRRMPYA
jgi:hypothetical protein